MTIDELKEKYTELREQFLELRRTCIYERFNNETLKDENTTLTKEIQECKKIIGSLQRYNVQTNIKKDAEEFEEEFPPITEEEE